MAGEKSAFRSSGSARKNSLAGGGMPIQFWPGFRPAVSHRELKAFVKIHRTGSWREEQRSWQSVRRTGRAHGTAAGALSKTDRMKIQLKISGKRVRHYCETMGVTVGWCYRKEPEDSAGAAARARRGMLISIYQLAFTAG